MTLQNNNHTMIDHQKPPYSILHQLTGFDKNLIRKIDQLQSANNHNTHELISAVLDADDADYTVVADHDSKMTHVIRVNQ